MHNYLPAITILIGSGILSGCTHNQLRWNTTHQSKSLTAIYEQQVLDNLAMFVHDADSLPFFSTPSTGSSQVTDQGSVGSDMTFKRAIGLETDVLKLFGQRQMLESWSLSPVSDPRRLELMRCAYQQVVANCGVGSNRGTCPDCDKLRNKFYMGDVKPTKKEMRVPEDREASTGVLESDAASPNAENEERTTEQPTIDVDTSYYEFSTDTGRTTPACLDSVCWFGYGCGECVPTGPECTKVGRYCGTYVWVLPGGQDELSKLTLCILDYALNQPSPAPAKATVQVEYRLTKEGDPVDDVTQIAQIIKAELSVDGKLPMYKPPSSKNQKDIRAAAESFLDQIRSSTVAPQAFPEQFQPPHIAPDIYQQQRELRAITPPPLTPP